MISHRGEGRETTTPHQGARLLSFEGRRLSPQEANRLLDLSFVFEVQERVDDAIALYSAVLHQYPLWADVHYRLGEAMEAQGNLPEAEKAYSRRWASIATTPTPTADWERC